MHIFPFSRVTFAYYQRLETRQSKFGKRIDGERARNMQQHLYYSKQTTLILQRSYPLYKELKNILFFTTSKINFTSKILFSWLLYIKVYNEYLQVA